MACKWANDVFQLLHSVTEMADCLLFPSKHHLCPPLFFAYFRISMAKDFSEQQLL
jgi:hypothetical protein